jgi:hypothetical protein
MAASVLINLGMSAMQQLCKDGIWIRYGLGSLLVIYGFGQSVSGLLVAIRQVHGTRESPVFEVNVYSIALGLLIAFVGISTLFDLRHLRRYLIVILLTMIATFYVTRVAIDVRVRLWKQELKRRESIMLMSQFARALVQEDKAVSL